MTRWPSSRLIGCYVFPTRNSHRFPHFIDSHRGDRLGGLASLLNQPSVSRGSVESFPFRRCKYMGFKSRRNVHPLMTFQFCRDKFLVMRATKGIITEWLPPFPIIKPFKVPRSILPLTNGIILIVLINDDISQREGSLINK